MRFANGILLSMGMLLVGAASAQSQAAGLPGFTLQDAGQAAGYGLFACDMPGSDVDAFRQEIDVLVPGGTGSAEFRSGEDAARDLVTRVRQTGDGNLSELRTSVCNDAQNLMLKTSAAKG